MCGGFTCSKNSLICLNIIYVVVAFILISVAAYAKAASIVTSLGVVSGIIACGVFLLFISIIGLIGASKHHQVMLFFYMIVLFIIFIIQFSVACACLAFNEEQQKSLALQGWRRADNSTKEDAQKYFQCCGYNTLSPNETTLGYPSCDTVPKCCENLSANQTCCADEDHCNCPRCEGKILSVISSDLTTVGGIGLFFSFTEFIGVFLTVRFRNQRDPRANPSAFL
ncbi:unnamed protein product [Meganyctiphanes norvegica]|uniref:Tetraspanin-31 n=1 Tax=Meganyctiphanes norvegica TaxID=48144 RepID=A0AAV2Q2Z3_MEGNR